MINWHYFVQLNLDSLCFGWSCDLNSSLDIKITWHSILMETEYAPWPRLDKFCSFQFVYLYLDTSNMSCPIFEYRVATALRSLLMPCCCMIFQITKILFQDHLTPDKMMSSITLYKSTFLNRANIYSRLITFFSQY